MAKYAGVQLALLLVDGYNLAPNYTEGFEIDKESITQETNPFGATNIQNTPVNIEKGMIGVLGGFFDAAVDPLFGVFNAVRGLSRIVCIGYEDNIIGRHFVGYEGAYDVKYVHIDKKDEIVKANLNLLVTGAINEGAIVQNLATFTADWDTKTGGAGVADAPVDYTLDPVNVPKEIASNTLANPTVVTMKTYNGAPIPHNLVTGQKVLFSGSNSTPSINGIQTVTVISATTFSVPVNVSNAGTTGSFVLASTTLGGVGYLQATAYSGFTGFIDKIMHSPDDSVYAALITFADFAAVTGPKKERKTVAGTIDRYLSNNGDVTGSGSVTVFTGLSRN